MRVFSNSTLEKHAEEIYERLCFSKAQKKTQHSSAPRKHLLHEAGKDLSGLILRYNFYTLHSTHVRYKYLYMYTSGVTYKYLYSYFIYLCNATKLFLITANCIKSWHNCKVVRQKEWHSLCKHSCIPSKPILPDQAEQTLPVELPLFSVLILGTLATHRWRIFY